jgi:hypothetical protein
MYLSKQWRESRIISIIAALALALALFLAVKGNIAIGSLNDQRAPQQGLGMVFVPLFYLEAILIAFWGWLAAGIGVGKNLGEESGSFLFTRPRSRAWFLWHDWGFAMAQIAIITLLVNLIVGFLLTRFLVHLRAPATIQLTPEGPALPVSILMALIGVGVLLFAGLIYGLTYLCTVLIKRAAGVMLGAGLLVGYAVLRGLLHYYFPSFHLPNLITDLFAFDHRTFNGLSDHLGLSLIARAVLMLLLPLATQVILDRSEI